MDGVASPLLSIIIPTLNSEKTLQTALDSCLQQQFADFELWVIDSVSRDNTLSIVKACAEKDTRIRLVSEPDKGIYDAMNKGIGLARGNWIFFLGSDDRLHDNAVLGSVFAALAPSGPADTAPRASVSSTPVAADTAPDLLYGDVISASYNGPYDGEFTFEKLLRRNISHQAIFYKKSLFDRIGIYNLRYKAHADWDFNIRCFTANGIRTKYLDRVIAEFGRGGISSRHDVPFLQEVLIPEKLTMLAQTGVRPLRSLPAYDEWWRLIRNAGIRTAGQFDGLARSGERVRPPHPGEPASASRLFPGGTIPSCLKRMIRWQSRISPSLLRKGILSKCLMFASYLINLLTGSI